MTRLRARLRRARQSFSDGGRLTIDAFSQRVTNDE